MKASYVSTNRLKQHVWLHLGGPKNILFIHGNGSSAIFWRTVIESLPSEFSAIAPDLRGYGLTEAVPANADLSFGDFVEDLIELLDHLAIDKVHLVGHSLGGGICYELQLAIPQRVQSVTLINPASPYGFGGTKNVPGELCWPDAAGAGGGLVNPIFVERINQQEATLVDDNSPLAVMNNFYWKPPFVPENINELVEGLLQIKTGSEFYPGDFEASSNFPFAKPGKWGPINCAGPHTKFELVKQYINLSTKSPVLWVRGDSDLIVSDASFFEAGTLGKLGFIPNYPGEEVYPPQPMVSQTRYVLEEYAKNGGTFTEEVIENTGHSPYIENLEAFNAIFHKFLNQL